MQITISRVNTEKSFPKEGLTSEFGKVRGKLGEGNGTPLQYSCPENPMDGGSWWATVHGVAKSHTRLSDFTFTFKDPCDYTELIWRRQWHPTPVLLPGESHG